MGHKSSFRGTSEIVEIEDENFTKVQHDKSIRYPGIDLRTEEKDRRSLPSNLGRISSLEDELSQLFETFNRRNSSQGTGYSPHSGMSSSKRHSSKKPMVPTRASSSSAHGISERVNLKQAFRGLCISQASEMAAMKRSAARSSGASEAGRITTMYQNVVVEDTSMISQDEGKGGLLEISLVPEDSAPSTTGASGSFSQNIRVLKSHEPINKLSKLEVLSKEKTLLHASSSNVGDDFATVRQSARLRTGNKDPSTEAGGVPSLAKTSQSENVPSLSASSSPAASEKSLMIARSTQKQNALLSASDEHVSRAALIYLSQNDKSTPLPSASGSRDGRNSLEPGNSTAIQTENVLASPARGFQRSKNSILQLEKPTHASSSYQFDIRHTPKPAKSSSTPYKSINEGSAAKSANLEDKGSAIKGMLKGSLPRTPYSGLAKRKKGKKSTRSVSRLVRPVVKTKNFVKRKTKKDLNSAHYSDATHSKFNNALYPGVNNVVCPRCQCMVADEWEEVGEELLLSPDAISRAELSPFSPVASPSIDLSPLSPGASPCSDINLVNGVSDVEILTYDLNVTIKSKEVVKVGGKSKSRDKGDFTQSSKSSPEECSSSTSISEESNLSRPSCCDRPHMSKDVRWQTIRQFKMQHGAMSLRHFNLLKKLGSGDIGTVYLAELLGTNCLFAIKVMDNEFLVRRKKIMRAQTEREILRMLDHPFLPTLYCQFTSDNLSCLVMEYCPGGDLHVLRQKQSGRCFTEQAARFYVAEVLLALEYLHMLGVIYRDLKPENILVREDGHIMLSDFDLSLRCAVNPMLLVSPSTTETTKSMSGPVRNSGCVQPFCIQQPSCQVSCFGPTKARKLKSEQADPLKPLPLLVAEPTSARSNSFVGTHEYLAPEIIKGEGHGSAVDWWTFGIFLYELLYGKTPFRGSGNEETLANVVMKSLKFPESPLVSLQARDLINRLLVKDPESRLGTERGSAEIKQHPFFEGLNWALIRCAVPPELPEFHRSYGVSKGSVENNFSTNGDNNGYLEYNASSSGEQLEFERQITSLYLDDKLVVMMIDEVSVVISKLQFDACLAFVSYCTYIVSAIFLFFMMVLHIKCVLASGCALPCRTQRINSYQ
ncbi:hypothetical protein V2J09_009635 [Rumex salicifolius]